MRVLYVSFVVLLLDQLTKILVKGISIPSLGIEIHGMVLGDSIPVIKNIFHITFIENPNMAFGIELGGKLFLSIFAIAASVALVLYLYRIRHDNFWYRFSIALILGGACGNLVDRIFHGLIYRTASLFNGSVVDFFDFNLFTINWGAFHFKFWPIFNVADMAVSIGVISLLFLYRPHHEASIETPSRESDPSVMPIKSSSSDSIPLDTSSPTSVR